MGNIKNKERQFGQSRDGPLSRTIIFEERVVEKTQLLQE
jgi:hypothetical protein